MNREWQATLTCREDIAGVVVVDAADDDVAAVPVLLARVEELHKASCASERTPDFACIFPRPCESCCKTCSPPESGVRGPRETDPGVGL